MARNRIILDSGALSALAEKSRSFRTAMRKGYLSEGVRIVVPTAVIAESTTGNQQRDANVNHILKSVSTVDLDVRIARNAAALRHAQRRKGAGTIDAIVVATADLVPGSEVITTDPKDLNLLTTVHGRTRVVFVADALRR
ncbi:MAG TPA: PIN domain-containing protein [Candidatus Cybelea sp.]|nr:PIN domain-containing protein [Candidatus Cybelea sp.]